MNKKQKIALSIMAITILLTLLFPPFHVVSKGTTINMGYGFILDPPKRGYINASVNSIMLLVQWVGILALGSLSFFLLKGNDEPYEKKKSSDLIQETSTDEIPFDSEQIEDQSKKFMGGVLHPWRRFWARTVDLIFLGLGIVFILTVIFSVLFPVNAEKLLKVYENPILAGLIIYFLWVPVEAAFLALTGTTPSKWIFGIRILKNTGGKLSYSEALKRTLSVWVQGEGMGIPIATLFTRLFAYRRLTKTGTTLWDTYAGSIVTHKKWGVIRGFACFIYVVVAMMFVSVLNSM